MFTHKGGYHSGITYVATSDGSSLRRLTTLHPVGHFADLHPDISPDGSRIVYATSRHKTNGSRNFEIETSKMDGSDRQRLTEHGYQDVYPIWSPNGAYIAFSRLGKGLFIMDADSSNERLITDKEPSSGLAWSPGGDTLAFVSEESLRLPDKDRSIRRLHLYTVRVDGSNMTLIFSSYDRRLDRISAPVWSPDGSRLAFSHNVDPQYKTLIRQSPDAYFTDFPAGTKPGLTLYTSTLGGSDLIQVMTVSTEPFISTLDKREEIEWSPDGSMMLVSPGGMLVNVDGSEFRELPVRLRGWGWSAWSPDGSEIAVLLPSSSSRAFQLYLIDKDVENARLIAKGDSDNP